MKMNKFIKCLNKTPWLERWEAAKFLRGLFVVLFAVATLPVIAIVIIKFLGLWFLFFTFLLFINLYVIDWSHFDKCGDNEDEL